MWVFFQLYKAKIFNLQGYIIYRPIQKHPNSNAFWLLVSSREDNTSESIKEGDILQNAIIDDATPLWQNHNATESRVLFYAQPYQCVIVIDNQKYDVQPDKENPKPAPGKWIKVALIPCPVDSPK